MLFSSRNFKRNDWISHIFYVVVYLTGLLMSTDKELKPSIRYAALSIVTLAVSFNLYELLLANNTWSIAPGRSAGYYVNPNISAGALVGYGAFFIGTRARTLDKYDFTLLAVIFLGVAATFSRTGMVMYFCVFFIVLRSRSVKKYYGMLFFAVASLAIGIVFISYVVPYIHLSKDAQIRLDSFLNSGGVADYSKERGVGALYYLESVFEKAWWTGFGVRYSLEIKNGPHNMFAGFASDYGVTGLIAYILLNARLAWNGIFWKRLRDCFAFVALPVAVWFFLYSFASHNLVYDPSIIFLIAMVSPRGQYKIDGQN
jgi:hypothetical protein